MFFFFLGALVTVPPVFSFRTFFSAQKVPRRASYAFQRFAVGIIVYSPFPNLGLYCPVVTVHVIVDSPSLQEHETGAGTSRNSPT